jgi:hypothetical protein
MRHRVPSGFKRTLPTTMVVSELSTQAALFSPALEREIQATNHWTKLFWYFKKESVNVVNGDNCCLL